MKYIPFIISFWLGFSLTNFTNVVIFSWQWWVICTPIWIGLGFWGINNKKEEA